MSNTAVRKLLTLLPMCNALFVCAGAIFEDIVIFFTFLYFLPSLPYISPCSP